MRAWRIKGMAPICPPLSKLSSGRALRSVAPSLDTSPPSMSSNELAASDDSVSELPETRKERNDAARLRKEALITRARAIYEIIDKMVTDLAEELGEEYEDIWMELGQCGSEVKRKLAPNAWNGFRSIIAEYYTKRKCASLCRLIIC